MIRLSYGIFISSAAFLGAVFAGQSDIDAAPAGQHQVEVLLTDGGILSGRLTEEPGGPLLVVDDDGKSTSVKWEGFVSARFRKMLTRFSVPEGVEGPSFCLWGRPTFVDDTVCVACPQWGRIELRGDRVSRLLFQPVFNWGAPEDVAGVRFVNGDFVEGGVRSASLKRVRIETPLFGKLTVDTSQISFVSLGGSPAAGTILGRTIRVYLVNGERIDGALVALSDGKLILDTPFGKQLRIPQALLLSIYRIPAPGVVSNPLLAADIKTLPFFDHRRDYYWHVMPDGTPLRVDGMDFAFGLCVPSRTRIDLPLSGDERLFSAFVGLHDVWGRFGNVDVKVAVDGKDVWEKNGLTAGGSERFNLPLADAGLLSIVIDYGGFADFGDWVVIGEPHLGR